MLPRDKIFTLKKDSSLNTAVLKKVIEKKFTVKFSPNPRFSSENLSQISEKIFSEILHGKFAKSNQNNQPLYSCSNKEIELYAKLNNIDGEKRKQDKKIQALFSKFMKKNQDLEINILRASEQLN